MKATARWEVLPPASPQFQTSLPSLPPLLAQLLYNRGVRSAREAEAYLSADERLQGDPFLLPGMHEAVARVERALQQGEAIAIYGDFDADGVAATVLLTETLSFLGARAEPYIPRRLEEGYGLNCGALDYLKAQGFALVITVDCGISALPEAEYARGLGLDLIITDHHSLPPLLPPALAVVDPKRPDSPYPFRELAGVGVAFKLSQALLRGKKGEEFLDALLDLVTLGTVTDMAPLLGENRYLVSRGLEVLNRAQRPGLQEIFQIADLRLGRLDTEAIAWVIGPRLNAAGRLDDALLSYHLLATRSPEEGRRLAQILEQKNTERQKLTWEVLAKAREQVLPHVPQDPLLIAWGPDYPPGVVGLVASKLTEEFYRPALVLSQGKQESRGSARSIPEFHITAALGRCRDLLTRFGGHAMAAGFSLPTANLASFKDRMLHIAEEELGGKVLEPSLRIDAEIGLAEMGWQTLAWLERLAPYGVGNPAPLFLSRGVRVTDSRSLGGEGQHLSLKLSDGRLTWPAIGFDLGEWASQVPPRLDIVYGLERETWQGEDILRLNLKDLRPAQS